MTAYPIQATFGRGELSPRLHARADIQHWQMGLDECFNFIVLRQGGLRRRPGTLFAGLAKKQDADDVSRIVPFMFSPTQAYVMEFSDGYVRFFTNAGQVTSGGSPYQVATPWDESHVPGLQFAQSGDVVYVVHRDVPPQTLTRSAETSWAIAEVDFQDGPYLEINTGATTIAPNGTGNIATGGTASAYSEAAGKVAADAFDTDTSTAWRAAAAGEAWLQYQFGTGKVVTGYVIQSEQFATDTSTLSAPRTWSFEGSNDGATWSVLDNRAGEVSWSYGERRYYTFANETAYTYYRIYIYSNNDATAGVSAKAVAICTLAFQGGGADAVTITLTASAVTGINKNAGFAATDVGRHIRIMSEDAYWHWFTINGYTSTTQVTAKLESPPLPTTKRSNAWRLGAFSETTGYPSCVSFFGERICFAGTNTNPFTIWGTKTGSLTDFGTSTPAMPDDGFSFTLREGGAIQWIAEGTDLLIGLQGMVRSLGAADKNEGFSATNYNLTRPARVGAAAIQPAMVGDTTIFISRHGGELREMQYSYEAQGYVAPDLGVLSEHVFRPGIVGVCYAAEPDSMLWAWLADGTFAGITYERDQQMAAIHRHAAGGDGFVESMCCIPGATHDEVWLQVRRTREDETEWRSIEVMKIAREEVQANDCVYLDCALQYAGPSATTITGMDHLDGYTVGIFADSASMQDDEVVSGDVTISDGVGSYAVSVGLKYESRAKTLRMAQGMGDGSGFGRKKRVKSVKIDVYLTETVKARAAGSVEDAMLRPADASMTLATGLRTGFYEARVDDRWTNGGQVTIVADHAGPATVRAVIPVFESDP